MFVLDCVCPGAYWSIVWYCIHFIETSNVPGVFLLIVFFSSLIIYYAACLVP